ncbi:MAG: hypothetical protein O7G29_10645 [Acidobacteria bacterium]|nr:hypothetical protein [Acidobacteriota bacterium]
MFRQKAKEEVDLSPDETDEMPIVPYRVLHTDIPFYSDPECKNEVPEATIAILEMLDPDDKLEELDVVPVLKKYEPGQLLRWNLNNKTMWEESWYRHPETGKIERAWSNHVEFTGAVISAQSAKHFKH